MSKNTHSSKRILIEDVESMKYLGANGRWTKNPEDGASFEATRTAFAAAKIEPIRKFNIVRYFSSTKQFINMDYGNGTGKETDSV